MSRSVFTNIILLLALSVSMILPACTYTAPDARTNVGPVDEYQINREWWAFAECMQEYLEGNMVFGELDNRSEVSYRAHPKDDRVNIVIVHAWRRVASFDIRALDDRTTAVKLVINTIKRPFLRDDVRNQARDSIYACS